MSIELGTRLGAYQVVEILGQGALGMVYRAYHPGLARPAAVRALEGIAPDQDLIARFCQGAQEIARLRHPNVLDIYDAGEWHGYLYLVVEYLPGGSLGDRLEAGVRFDDPAALHLLEAIAAALDHAHGLDVVHGDLKPANVLLDGSDSPVIADFGLAQLLRSGWVKDGSGVTVGTPAYLAPEQVMGSSAGPAADIYALATIAYELLARATPFEGEEALELLHAHVHREPRAASTHNPDLPPAVDAALARGLAKDPEARWENGSALVAALRDALAREPAVTDDTTTSHDQPIPTSASTELEPARYPTPPVRRRFRLGLLLGAAGGVLLPAAVLLLALLWLAHPTLSLATTAVEQGGIVAARFDGFKPGQSVDVFIAGTRQQPATIRTDILGRAVYAFTVPRTVAPGPHEMKGCSVRSCARAVFIVALKRGP